jgi:hypothetical protein
MFNPKANVTPMFAYALYHRGRNLIRHASIAHLKPVKFVSVFKRDCLKATSVNARGSHDQQNNLRFATLIATYANYMVTNIYNFLRSYQT